MPSPSTENPAAAQVAAVLRLRGWLERAYRGERQVVAARQPAEGGAPVRAAEDARDAGADPDARERVQAGSEAGLGSRDRDELIIADLDLDTIREVRNTWQFFRDRRPETYGGLCRA